MIPKSVGGYHLNSWQWKPTIVKGYYFNKKESYLTIQIRWGFWMKAIAYKKERR